ncbi:hypothetical protein AUK11_00470 [bacterium CG2_30_37_16]|nr:MAG: hypothetical protein AUK11_00470 [bacterium CG2_30_37_16]PIP30393.1 MAG: hypothetical protein COX25_04870 [bacterium (Candidatus Howlettbacteria) CG23_combo_of_CG06-09_8_20_14_all_37_9]PIX98902.1 MAG: hypothetical protein COZ22_03905 [bacterium (Candidatus Howlettbacteria) CG_4_10_14_3_um_filter_37_10]PJB05878.1 MAG: hypothetical protein CO123_03140 [bacterium (Candidatus Howlettbacteria) CG_4_9_14_3_um_filter_37_10]
MAKDLNTAGNGCTACSFYDNEEVELFFGLFHVISHYCTYKRRRLIKTDDLPLNFKDPDCKFPDLDEEKE